MTILIPLENVSRLSPHFGKAPFFGIYDLGLDQLKVIPNPEFCDCGHDHNKPHHCVPVACIREHQVKAVLCNSMGRGAFQKLERLGVDRFHTTADTIPEAMRTLSSGPFIAMTEQHLCKGHDHGSQAHSGDHEV
jgi:predicted Fe-Mo cluster-binding NifX family protein